jgi:hypothetical protein
MKDNNHIDNIFKHALDDLHETAPPAVWESLSNDLDKKQAAHFREKYFRLRKLAVLLLLVILSSSAYLLYFYPASKKYSSRTQQNSSIAASSKKETIQNTASGNTSAKEKTTAENNQQRIQPKPQNVLPAAESIQTLPAASVMKNKSTHEIPATENSGLNTGGNPQNLAASAIKKNQPASSFNKKEISEENIIPGKQPPAQSNRQLVLLSAIKSTKQSGRSGKNIMNSKNPDAESTDPYTYAGHENNVRTKTNSTLTGEKSSQSSHEKNIESAENRIVRVLAVYPSNLFLSAIKPIQPFPDFHILLLSDSTLLDARLKIAEMTSKKKPLLANRFSLTAFISPNHSFTRLENDNRLASPGQDKNEALNAEQQGSSYSAGILINYSLNKKWIVQSGLAFSSAKTNIAAKTIYARPDNNGHLQYEFNCSSGYSFITPKNGNPTASGDSIRTMPSSSTINYIAVPVSLNYVWQKGKFLLKPGIGLSLNFLTSGNSATNFGAAAGNQKEKARISGLKNSYLDGALGFGAEFMLSRRISIGIRPSMRLALSAINKDTPVRTYQNYTSLETGLKINL